MDSEECSNKVEMVRQESVLFEEKFVEKLDDMKLSGVPCWRGAARLEMPQRLAHFHVKTSK